MRQNKIFNTRTVLIIVISAILIGFVGNVLISCVERLIYPQTYSDEVIKYANEHSVPVELVFAIIKVESNFNTRAVSSAGAVGLMQMLPSTYEWLAELRQEPIVPSLLYDAQVSISYGTYYLRYLYAKFGSWEKVIIAYNWGEGNFSRFLEINGYEEGDYDSIPVKETRNYVKKVMHHWEKYQDIYK